MVLVGGRRYGLIGRNGSGKTTFLDALARRKIPGVPSSRSVLLVKQEIEGDKRSPLEWVLSSDTRLQVLLEKASRLEKKNISLRNSNEKMKVNSRLSEIYAAIAQLEEETKTSESKGHKILYGLGFSAFKQKAATNTLSGGWRMRVGLACALFMEPSLLLLDEPTNHLDLETVLWLQSYLANSFANTLVVVSHDRYFLNAVVTDVMHLDRHSISVHRGDFSSFEKVTEERRKQQLRLKTAQELKRVHLQEYITKHAELGSNGPKAAKQRKSRMKRMARLGMEAQAEMQGRRYKASYDGEYAEVDEIQADGKVVLNMPDPGQLKGTLITLDEVTFTYPSNNGVDNSNKDLQSAEPLLKKVNFSMGQSSRIALVGRNGCGKSTLIKLVMGHLNPQEGISTRSSRARIGYIAQHHVDQLDMDLTALDLIASKYPGDSSLQHIQRLRQHLAAFGIGGATLPSQKIRTLSGGQKCRVCMAITMYCRPHILIMDEPTNHLDLETTQALIKSLSDFKGGLLVVSHDQYLLSSVCRQIWVCGKKTMKRFNGTFLDYKKKILRKHSDVK